MSFLINQRVIVDGEIAVTIHPPKTEDRPNDGRTQWVKLASGITRWYDYQNVHSLPNGQL